MVRSVEPGGPTDDGSRERAHERAEGVDRSRLIYRWDLDKTYLRTEFDSVRDLVRTAFESPRRKQTVPGAAALLREIRATEPEAIYILSGSPEQMRRALEAKLRLDGVQWDAFTLKPNLRNLMQGRFRALRDQVGYKLAALLASRARAEPGTAEVLFGDDAEGDAFIYSLYADLCAGRVGTETFMTVLRRAKVYDEDIPGLVRLSEQVPRQPTVRRIFIHLDRMSPPDVFDEFGVRLCPFYNYFQPAVVLLEDGAIEANAVLRVGVEIVLHHAFPPDALTASFFDLVRRGYVGRRGAERLLTALDESEPGAFADAGPVLTGFADELRERLGGLEEAPPLQAASIDYVRLFSRDKARARSAQRRARRRRPG